MRFFATLLGALLLTACVPGGTAVFNREGNLVGRVRVHSDQRATVYDRNSRNIGRVQGELVRDRSGREVGVIDADGIDVIRDPSGKEFGSMRTETECYDRGVRRIGRLSADIDDEAAGGACLLLLIAP